MAEYQEPGFYSISPDPVQLQQAAQKITEQVHSPKHYTSGRLETIYQIQDALGAEGFKAYCIGNALKYINRHSGKNGDEDLKKAYVYLGWATNGLPEPIDGRVPRD